MEALVISILHSEKMSLLMKLLFMEPFHFAPDDNRTQLILLVAFLIVMYYAEKYDLFKLRRNSARFRKDDGLQKNTSS